jgi:hypothetical protein
MKSGGKKIVYIVFPPTPGNVRYFDHKWYVAVDEQRKKIYFWDGKSENFNFMYNFGYRGLDNATVQVA